MPDDPTQDYRFWARELAIPEGLAARAAQILALNGRTLDAVLGPYLTAQRTKDEPFAAWVGVRFDPSTGSKTCGYCGGPIATTGSVTMCAAPCAMADRDAVECFAKVPARRDGTPPETPDA
jgi:hypothetical protein